MDRADRLAEIGKELGQLVREKNLSYGSSFEDSSLILKILYPEGVAPEQYTDMLLVVRILDKLKRLATRKDAFGESPWKDICGYAICGIYKDEK